MTTTRLQAALVAALLATTATALPAYAHHGWSWTESGFFQIEGLVKEISFGNPHPTIVLDVEGELWTIELAPPAATEGAGFTADVVAVGDELTAIGNRSADPDETRMKAVRVVVAGTNYDVYPSRARNI